VPDGGGWRVVPGEGGHRGFAPETERQLRFIEHWRPLMGRLSDELVCSGPGIERLYAFERAQSPAPASALDAVLARGGGAEDIARAADAGDALAVAAIQAFAELYGQIAGDHALGVMATGGVFLAGGIAPKLLPHLRSGALLRGFHAKGAQSAWMAQFPVHVVMHESLGLLGAAVIAARL
jgi:glucokinase